MKKRLLPLLLFTILLLPASAQDAMQVPAEKAPEQILHFDQDKVQSKYYDAKRIKKKIVKGVPLWFYKGKRMDGIYRGLAEMEFVDDGFAFDLYLPVYRFEKGIKNDTVRRYKLETGQLVDETITLDSDREVYKSYYSDGTVRFLCETTDGKLDGVRRRWHPDGKSDLFENFKDGKQCGQQLSWYANGWLASIEKYVDDKQVLPILTLVYTGSSYDQYRDVPPDQYHITSSLAADNDSNYRLEETYRIDSEGIAHRIEHSFYDDNYYNDDEAVYRSREEADSVRCDTLREGPNRRLEIRAYKNGALFEIENYPIYGDAPGNHHWRGPFVERYDTNGKLIEKLVYDFKENSMVSERIFHNYGATVTEITPAEYARLLADSCNLRLNKARTQYTSDEEKLTLFTKAGQTEYLNNSRDDNDSYLKWEYDGSLPRMALHFISFSGFENWGQFAVSDLTGQATEIMGTSLLLFCAKSDLFCITNDDYYEGTAECLIYKMLPGGRIAQVATCDRGFNMGLDLTDLTWVGGTTLVATKTFPEGKNYIWADQEFEDDSNVMPEFVRIDINPEALQQATPLPFTTQIQEMNQWTKILR